MKTRGRKGAFTLTELLVVMSVVIILLSMLIVGVEGIFVYAGRMQCQHHMEQTWKACLMYQNDNRALPFVWDVDARDRQGAPWYFVLATRKYVNDESLLRCPSSDIVSQFGSAAVQILPGLEPENADALEDTLRWLAAQQIKTGTNRGMWARNGDAGYDQTATALCILAFLGAGKTG